MMNKKEYLKLFERNDDPDYPYEEKFADFKKELLKVSNHLGLGEISLLNLFMMVHHLKRFL